jgi:hypothetical protein
MEPRRDRPKAPKTPPQEKRKRFQLIRLEDRIAPKEGGKATHNCDTAFSCRCTIFCTGYSIE